VRAVKFRGKWYAYWREDGRSKRRVLDSKTVKSRNDAERAILDVKRLIAGKEADTIDGIVEKYLADKTAMASHKDAQYAWNAIQPDIGHLRPDQIDRYWCRSYIAKEQKKKLSNATIRKRLTIVRAALNWIDKRHPAQFEFPPAAPPRLRSLSRDEAQQLIEAAQVRHVRGFIVLALTTGARSAAILDLTWKHIDFNKGIINLGRSTGNKGRAILPMSDDARMILEELHEARVSDFVIEHGGRKIISIKKGFHAAVVAAGLVDQKGKATVTPHVLRHTAAVWMAEAGVPMTEISQYLGHSSTRITESVYARFSPEYLKSASAALHLNLNRVQRNPKEKDKKLNKRMK
jgi:integrase